MKTIWLFVTNDCNLNCGYCYIRKNPSDISLKVARKIIDKLIADSFFNEHHVVLFGGEPLLKINLIKNIVSYGYAKSKIKNKKITFSIYSNGTLMNDKNIKTLHKIGVGLDLSLDGIKSSQDQERLFKNKKSSFSAISKNIPRLLKSYPNSMVHACITPANVKYLSKSVEFFYNQGFKRVYLQPITSANWSKEELEIFQKELIKIFIAYKKLIDKGRKLYLNILEDYIKKLKTEKQESNTPCPAGIYNFAFSTKGEIFPCHRFVTLGLEEKFQNHKEDYRLGDINNGITNKKLRKYFTNFKFNENPKCKKCELSKVCCGNCHWERYHKNQSYSKLNETVCIIQGLIVDVVKKFLAQFPSFSKLDFSTQFKGLNIPKNHLP